MILTPRKVKYRKHQRGKRTGISSSGNQLNFGSFGLVAQESGWLTSRQIEAARRAMTRHIKKGGKIWIRIFPSKVVTARPPETRMGGGKGSPEKFVAVIKPGRILFEMDGVSENLAYESMMLASAKLPIKTKFLPK